MKAFHWLINTDAGLLTRIAAGTFFFLVMAIIDLRRHGRKATRWREYLVLITAVAIAVTYGAVNDVITSHISWEYFYYGKDLQQVLRPYSPYHPERLYWEAAKIGMKATWSAGLLIGVAILLANNPRKNLPQLSFARLLSRIVIVMLCCASFATLFGAIGYHGSLVGLSADFQEMVRNDEFRPYRFMAAYGVHLGGYFGGVVGTTWAVGSILRERGRMKASLLPR